jgi:carbamate kinase
MQQERAKDLVPIQTLDILGAMTQGQIGYLLQQALINCLKEEGIDIPVCTVITQVLVDKNDPEFSKDAASKPVGNFLPKRELKSL